MIQATELRLGNYVLYNGIIMSVIAIESPKPRKEKRFDGKYLVELFGGTGFITATTDQVAGIEFTEGLLLNCGFSYNCFNITDWAFLKIHFYKGKPLTELCIQKHSIVIDCFYLHQLQNVIHSLTNTELKINLHSK